MLTLLLCVATPSSFANTTFTANNDQSTDSSALAQVAGYPLVTEADYLNDIPVILTATRMSQPVNTAPASVTVISREMIDASGAQEIGDLLRLVPGFQVGYFNGISMSLAYHGFTGNYDRRLQVLIDGRSAYMPFLSTVEWLSLPLDISEVEKIEVIRSSNAPVYGSNAMQGVINIITRKSFEDEGFMLEGRWGTHDITGVDNDVRNLQWTNFKNKLDDRKYLLRYANSFYEFDYRVTLGYQKDLGFDNVFDTKKLNLIHVNSQYQLNARELLDVQFGFRAGDMNTFADGSAEEPNRNKSVDSQYQSVSWSQAQADGNELKVHFYHNYYDQDDEVRITDSVFNVGYGIDGYGFGVYYGTAERFDLEVEKIITTDYNIRMIMGVGLRLDRIKSKYLLNTKGFIKDESARVFSNVEWHLTDRVILNGGLMLENNEQIGNYYSPRLAVNFIANDEHVFRASVTRSTRTPSLLENNIDVGVRTDSGEKLYTSHISATNLKPERQDSVEIGYMFNSRNQDLRLDTKIFVERLRDGILEASNYDLPDEPWVWGNNTWADIQGIESQLFYKPHRRFFINLSHSRTSTKGNWHKYDNRTDGKKPSDWDISNSVPKDTFSGLFSFAISQSIDWSFTYYFMTEMNWLQDGNIVEEHDRLDTNIDWHKKLSVDSNLSLIFTLQNMLSDYVEVRDETVFKQRAFLKARYEW